MKNEKELPMDKELLEILACPACKTDVVLTDDMKGLQCIKCKRIYPIKDGIPIMLIEEAIEPEKS